MIKKIFTDKETIYYIILNKTCLLIADIVSTGD